MSYLRYSRAEEMDVLTEQERINSVLNRWENIFPGATNNLESGTTQSWALEEWSKGAWASPTSSQDAALAAHIGAAEERIHFAGEHALIITDGCKGHYFLDYVLQSKFIMETNFIKNIYSLLFIMILVLVITKRY
ncbi:MAG: hypothetical protein CM1200mP31_2870 [Candidatus Neomarinimicrobiota bacterium]|nr:MAG: hypothetical protein CM1200mP31_2870 [Candidatus Neomarinimicrobiota bacterium]